MDIDLEINRNPETDKCDVQGCDNEGTERLTRPSPQDNEELATVGEICMGHAKIVARGNMTPEQRKKLEYNAKQNQGDNDGGN